MKTNNKSRLVNVSFKLGKERVSFRIEPELRDSLKKVAELSNQTASDICRLIRELQPHVQMASAVRVYLVNYWQTKAKNNG